MAIAFLVWFFEGVQPPFDRLQASKDGFLADPYPFKETAYIWHARHAGVPSRLLGRLFGDGLEMSDGIESCSRMASRNGGDRMYESRF